MNWRDTIPSGAPTECWDAPTFGEALYLGRIELDLIEEGQEAAGHYTKRQIRNLRKWLHDNRLSLAEFMGTTVDKLR